MIDETERISINYQNIPNTKLQELKDKLNLDLLDLNIELTYFEKLTVIAFWYFWEHKQCDYILLETGMGGRLDATNIIKNIYLAIITNISFDHQEYLGNTIEDIAIEKAGIIKAGKPYILNIKQKHITDLIQAQASEINAQYIFLNNHQDLIRDIVRRNNNLIPEYQIDNINLAINALEYCLENNSLDNTLFDKLPDLVNNWNYQGRYQWLKPNIILDGSHNQEGIQVLLQSINSLNFSKVVFLIGCLKHKNWQNILDEIINYIQKNRSQREYLIKLTLADTIGNSISPDIMLNYIHSLNVNISVIVENNLHSIFDYSEDNLIVCCGSLYLVGNILKLKSI